MRRFSGVMRYPVSSSGGGLMNLHTCKNSQNYTAMEKKSQFCSIIL